MVTRHLSCPDDVDGFLSGLRYALGNHIDPNSLHWNDGLQAQASLLEEEAIVPCPVNKGHPMLLPRSFIALVRTVVLHDDPDRFHLLHTMAAEILRDRGSWADALNPARLRLERMAREVRREIHKMHAFVRFRIVADEMGECHVAWFEPAHHIVRAATPFFVNRFAAMRWSILTPRGCAYWDRHTLIYGPPVASSHAPAADAGEALWLAYYRSIFNPARIKLNMMRREMPVRFWRHLPETAQVTSMLQEADERVSRMCSSLDGPRNHKAGKIVQARAENREENQPSPEDPGKPSV